MNKVRVRGTHSVPRIVSALQWDFADPFMRLVKLCLLELKDEKMQTSHFDSNLCICGLHISQPQVHRTTATTLEPWQA